jgi:hypothetical protein
VPLVYFFIQHKVHHVAGGMSPSSLSRSSHTDVTSVHHLRLLRVGPRPPRRGLRRRHCDGL